MTKDAFDLYKANSPFGNKNLNFAEHLNGCLLKGICLDDDFKQKAAELDEFFKTYHYRHEGLILYRAACDGTISGFVDDGYINYPAFMSTTYCKKSVYKHIAKFTSGACAFLEITFPKGGAALDMEMREKFGGSEKEILLPRGSKFQVNSIHTYSGVKDISSAIGSNDYYAKRNSSLQLYRLTAVVP